MNAVIKLYLLGKFQLKIRDKDCTALLSYDKVKLLLSILCLSPNRSFSRAYLAEMLWPGASLEDGRSRLRHALHTLRQAFSAQPDILSVTRSAGVSLQSKCFWVDILDLIDRSGQEFQADTDMPAMYAGNFLEGVKLPESEAFNLWHRGWLARSQTELYTYRSGLINHYLKHRQLITALRLTKEWVQQQPHEEGYHRLAIRALISGGDKQAALHAYEHCCVMLQETLGVQPSRETFALLGIPSTEILAPSFNTVSGVQHAGYRPFATVAIAIAWKPAVTFDSALHASEDAESEDGIDAIKQWQEHVRGLAAQQGAWVSDTGGSTVLAHFGYPSFVQWPIDCAVMLAKTLAQLVPPDAVKIGLAIHADNTLITEAFTPNVNGLLYQSIVPLAWEAQHGQILLSPQAAARMSAWKVNTLGDRMRKRYEFDRNSAYGQPIRIRGRVEEFDRLNKYWMDHNSPCPLFVNLCGLPGLGKGELAKAMSKLVINTGGRVVLFRSTLSDKNPFNAFDNWLYSQLKKTDQFTLKKESIDHAAHQLKMARSVLADDELTVDYIVDQALMLLNSYKDGSLPLLIVWKNLDEADFLSIKFLQALVNSKNTTKIMIIGQSCQPITAIKPQFHLTLKPFERKEVTKLLAYRTRAEKIPVDVKNQMVSRSAGNSFYLEEMLHLYQLGLPTYYIPRVADYISVQLCYMDKETRNLAYLVALLEKLAIDMAISLLGTAAACVQKHLAKLVGCGLIRQCGDEYCASNAMIKLAIQKIMTRQDKQQLYTKVASFFIQRKQPAELIAKQLQQARSPDAAKWWRQAITEAMRQGSIQKAASHVTDAIISYQYIQDVQLRKRYELEGYFTLGSLQVSNHGPVSSYTIAAYDKAADVDPSPGGVDQLPVIWGRWLVTHSNADLLEALQLAKKIKRIALLQNQATWYGWSLYAEAQYYFWVGNPSSAERLLSEAISALLQTISAPPEHSPLGNHSDALAFSALGLAQAVQGRHEAAMQNASEAIKRAEQSHSSVSLTICHIQQMRIYYLADQLPLLHTHSLGILARLQRDAPDSIWCAIASAYVQMCKILLEPASSDAQACLSLMIPVMEQNLPLGRGAFLCLVARSHIAVGNTGKALSLLDQALQLSEDQNSRLIVPEIHCLYGDIWMKSARPDLAEQHWRKARGFAQKNQLLCYEAWVSKRMRQIRFKTGSSPLQRLAI